MRAAVRIFGTADMGPRVQALLFARHMAATLPPPATELAIKAGPSQPAFGGTASLETSVHATSASKSRSCMALETPPG